MQKVFEEVNSLDKRCYKKFGLTEDILMENASSAMLGFIEQKFKSKSSILIVSGLGNNGADGIALARMLYGKYKVDLYIPFDLQSKMGLVQLKRAKLLGVNIVDSISNYNVIVDCLFGTGLNRELDNKSILLLNKLNKLDAYKIACDIPSGINSIGQVNQIAFQADTTITMGGLKQSLFLDEAKDYIGEIIVSNLGIQRVQYEIDTDVYLLDKLDILLPFRTKQSTHKGTFGHLSVVIGDKKGAGLLSCSASLYFGVGLVTAITNYKDISNSIMTDKKLPQNTTAMTIGMGLGKRKYKNLLKNNISKVIDADMFYKRYILKLLDDDNIVLTPHPKEFINLLKLTNIADITIDKLQKNRFKYIKLFCKKYPKVVLLLKGANTLIGQDNKLYINTFGTSALSFGGSGDILSGLIGALMAQGYSSIDAAITGSLAHSLAAKEYKGADFSLTPENLIEQLKYLSKTTIKKI